MRARSELHGDVRVIHVEGSWTGGRDDEDLREEFKRWVAEGEKCFVIDLSGVDLLNSVGLGALVSYYTTLARHDGKLVLAGMSDRHRRAAYVARILDLFEDHDSVEEAVRSCGS